MQSVCGAPRSAQRRAHSAAACAHARTAPRMHDTLAPASGRPVWAPATHGASPPPSSCTHLGLHRRTPLSTAARAWLSSNAAAHRAHGTAGGSGAQSEMVVCSWQSVDGDRYPSGSEAVPTHRICSTTRADADSGGCFRIVTPLLAQGGCGGRACEDKHTRGGKRGCLHDGRCVSLFSPTAVHDMMWQVMRLARFSQAWASRAARRAGRKRAASPTSQALHSRRAAHSAPPVRR